MPIRGVIFDLFHTLTGLESEWSDLPGTWALLGLDRRAWDEALTMKSHWRVIGELRDPLEPEPGIYQKCLEELGIAPEECVFVGDGVSNELVGAKEVGLKTVFISGIIGAVWPERVPPRKAVADHHIEKLPEILKLPGLIA